MESTFSMHKKLLYSREYDAAVLGIYNIIYYSSIRVVNTMHSYSTPSSSSTLVLWIRLVRENRNSYPYYAYYELVCILLGVLLASTLVVLNRLVLSMHNRSIMLFYYA